MDGKKKKKKSWDRGRERESKRALRTFACGNKDGESTLDGLVVAH